MAANFKIVKHRSNDILTVVLKGVFDGTSAWELINSLKDNCKGINKVIIKTEGLEKVYPFGRDVAMSNLDQIKRPLRIRSDGSSTGRVVLEFRNKNNFLSIH